MSWELKVQPELWGGPQWDSEESLLEGSDKVLLLQQHACDNGSNTGSLGALPLPISAMQSFCASPAVSWLIRSLSRDPEE